MHAARAVKSTSKPTTVSYEINFTTVIFTYGVGQIIYVCWRWNLMHSYKYTVPSAVAYRLYPNILWTSDINPCILTLDTGSSGFDAPVAWLMVSCYMCVIVSSSINYRPSSATTIPSGMNAVEVDDRAAYSITSYSGCNNYLCWYTKLIILLPLGLSGYSALKSIIRLRRCYFHITYYPWAWKLAYVAALSCVLTYTVDFCVSTVCFNLFSHRYSASAVYNSAIL